ncbi:hypothetical protein BBK82_46925 [Lentzea guizhouensis]|uniref:Uncharacterized protein n=1 Tax=Lentzea guizhouensis TaxID=1586287 RepID=A0A1B2HX62_9PSEU|nr:hypothetical protein BBK82_46925 [Lentzea guizhouensis]
MGATSADLDEREQQNGQEFDEEVRFHGFHLPVDEGEPQTVVGSDHRYGEETSDRESDQEADRSDLHHGVE